jgi:DNA-binding GntR family transcriptional regulator
VVLWNLWRPKRRKAHGTGGVRSRMVKLSTVQSYSKINRTQIDDWESEDAQFVHNLRRCVTRWFTTSMSPTSPSLLPVAAKVRSSSHVPRILVELEGLIESGELAPGARINESALAARLGVSRAPIREACRLLEQAGLVHAVLNRGVFVKTLTAKEAIDLYDVRSALYGLAAQRAVERMSGQLLSTLDGLVKGMEAAIDADDISQFYPLNREFHDAILEAADNAMITTTLMQLESRLHSFRRRGLVRQGGMRASNNEHRAVLEAIRAGDGAAAARLAQAHVAGGKNRLMNFLLEQGGIR